MTRPSTMGSRFPRRRRAILISRTPLSSRSPARSGPPCSWGSPPAGRAGPSRTITGLPSVRLDGTTVRLGPYLANQTIGTNENEIWQLGWDFDVVLDDIFLPSVPVPDQHEPVLQQPPAYRNGDGHRNDRGDSSGVHAMTRIVTTLEIIAHRQAKALRYGARDDAQQSVAGRAGQ